MDESIAKSNNLDLDLRGKACLVHRNESAVRSLNQGNHLIERSDPNFSCHIGVENDFGGDPDSTWLDENKKLAVSRPIIMERHDVRALLDDLSISQFSFRRNFNIDDGIDEKCQNTFQKVEDDEVQNEVDPLHFEDLVAFLPTSSKNDCKINNRGDGNGVECMQGSSAPCIGSFELTAEQWRELPKDLTVMPKTMRQNTIMEHTASRVASSSQSSQLEVFLKAKQSTNSEFSFLSPSNELHPYYLYLKEKHKSAISKGSTSANKNVQSGSSCDAREGNFGIASLLGCYSSFDDDDKECGEKSDEGVGEADIVETSKCVKKPTSTKSCRSPCVDDCGVSKDDKGNIFVSNKAKIPTKKEDPNDDKKRKAERLERVRRWKASRVV